MITLSDSTGADLRHLARPPDPGGVHDPEIPPVPPEQRIHRVPGGPGHVADERPLFLQQPVDERGLADVRPPDDRDADLPFDLARQLVAAPPAVLGLGLSVLRHRVVRPARRRTQQDDDLVEQVTDSLAVLRGNLDHRLDPQLEELHRAVAGAAVVHLVHRHEDRLPARTQRLGDLVVARRASLPAVHDQHEQVGHLDRPLPCSSTSAWSGSSLTPNMPPVSVSRKSVRFQLTGCEITSRVVPGTGVTMARRDAVILLNSVDLPTFGLPTSTTTGLARVCTFRL